MKTRMNRNAGNRGIRTIAAAAFVATLALSAGSAMALPRVALLMTDSLTANQALDPQSKLMATGLFERVDLISVAAGTPSMIALKQYNAVMVWSNNNFADSALLGDRLADYTDQGRGVVNTVFSVSTTSANRFLLGRFSTEGYSILTPNVGNSTGSTTMGVPLLPAHPIVNGVNAISSGTTGSRPTTASMLPHGQMVVTWADGRPLAAVSTTFPRRVDLGIYPPSSDASTGWWNAATDGAKLMGNALVFASGSADPNNPPFVNASVSIPIVPAGTNVQMQVQASSGSNPASTGMSASADLMAFGGSATQALADQGGDLFTYTLSVPSSQSPGVYAIVCSVTDLQGRTGQGELVFRVTPAIPAGFTVESEPNDSRATAQHVDLVSGGGVYGRSTGSSTTVAGDTSIDSYLLKMPAMPSGIYRHRMVITASGTAGHTGTIRGYTQTTGTINTASDSAVQTSSTGTTPPRFNQWYGFGKQEEVEYRVTGVSTTTSEYMSTLVTDPVTPLVAATAMTPGEITIRRADGVTAALDMLVYDANFNPVGDYLTDGVNSLVRTYAAGVYYLAVSNSNTCDTRATPADASARSSPVLANPHHTLNSVTTTVANMGVAFQWGAETQTIMEPKDEPYEVVWIKFTVGTPSQKCQPADIASDDGTPLPTDLNLHPNGGVNEGDYNSFFQGFFDATSNCDIANDDGTPLPPFGTAGVNGGVNEGDYNCFFQKFFDGCPV